MKSSIGVKNVQRLIGFKKWFDNMECNYILNKGQIISYSKKKTKSIHKYNLSLIFHFPLVTQFWYFL